MRKSLVLLAVLAALAAPAAAHMDTRVDVEGPLGVRWWTYLDEGGVARGTFTAETGTRDTAVMVGYDNHDGTDSGWARFHDGIGYVYCSTVSWSLPIVPESFSPQWHFTPPCRPTFVYDAEARTCASSCPPVPRYPIVTNSFAYNHPGDPRAQHDPYWFVTHGTLYQTQDGAFWTGVPDSTGAYYNNGMTANYDSIKGSGSCRFRAYVKRRDFTDVAVSFDVVNEAYVETSTHPAANTDGIRVILRYQGDDTYYAAEINRRSGRIGWRKRYLSPTGPTEAAISSTYAYAPDWGGRTSVRATSRNLPEGGVELVLHVGDLTISSVDRGEVGGSPLSGGGSVGLSSNDTQFRFYDWKAVPLGGPSEGAGVFAQVRAYPNPWRSDAHAGVPFTFDNLPADGTIRIFTLSGRFVKELPYTGTSVAWTLANDSGEDVGSGFYLYTIETAVGKTTGRLAVVR